jgi:methanogenic corrinoid protein MtbC1
MTNPRVAGIPGVGNGGHPLEEDLYQEYLQALLEGRRPRCAEIVRRLVDEGWGVKDTYEGLFQRSLYEVGDLWERNRISVADEHLASAVTQNLMQLLYPLVFASERGSGSVVVTCISGEHHQIGARMVADIFEVHGWDAHFLGGNTPAPDLARIVLERNPTFLCISVSMFFNLPSLVETVAIVREAAGIVPILVGGQAFRCGGKPLPETDGLQWVEDLTAVETLICGYEPRG